MISNTMGVVIVELELEVGLQVGNFRSMDTTATSAFDLVERKVTENGLMSLIWGRPLPAKLKRRILSLN